MSRIKISDDVIAARMVELRNLRTLHAQDRQQITALKTELTAVKAQNGLLETLVAELRQQNATQAIQIAELQTMVFGKKRKPPMSGTPIVLTTKQAPHRRPIPPARAITKEVVLPLPESCVCGGSY